ncbi:unnamed protein product [Caenorhabditis nigoni]
MAREGYDIKSGKYTLITKFDVPSNRVSGAPFLSRRRCHATAPNQFNPSEVDLDELYPPTCKFIVSYCKHCHGFRAGLGDLRTDEYECSNCNHESGGLMAFATLQEAIWFKNHLILIDLYQKLQSRLQIAILEEGTFKSHFIGVCTGFYRNWMTVQPTEILVNLDDWKHHRLIERVLAHGKMPKEEAAIKK